MSALIGPFSSNKSTSNTLQDQYISVFGDKSNYEEDEGFFELHESEDGVEEIDIREEGIRTAIESTKNGSPGCDGITPFLL